MPSKRAAVLALAAAQACAIHDPTPAAAPKGAAGGHAPPGFDSAIACSDWRHAVGLGGSEALTHRSYPDADPATSCYVPVRYGANGVAPDPVPPGCGYPSPEDGSSVLAELDRLAERYERVASGVHGEPSPPELDCRLAGDVRVAAARANARTARALRSRLAAHAPYAYAAVGAFGYGFGAQSRSALVPYRPGDPCPTLSADEAGFFFSVNADRATRAAAAYQGGVAPVVVASGGAVHSRLTEAFLLQYLLVCRAGVPADAVFVDPCADHTHTNVRNTGSLVVAIKGRTAYLVTDDGVQSDYLEEWTAFDLIGGSIDQRALRDFGYLLGSFRRASVGMKAGFWYTPYRFWAEPVRGLGGLTCVP